MSTFHHAYNGIPTVNSNKSVQFEGDAFGYVPLDYIAPDRLSGFINVEIKTMTPTLPGFKTRDGVIAVPSVSGKPDGARSIRDAFIPATALKGMLSSAYEAVTMSRLRIFDQQHKRVYSHRPPARKAQSTYPAFLTHNGSYWEIIFPFRKNNAPRCAAHWAKWRTISLIDSTEGDDGYKDVKALRTEFPHLSEVYYKKVEKKIQNNTTRHIATHIQLSKDGKKGRVQALDNNTDKTNTCPYRGFIVRTRNGGDQPTDSGHKRYEFIFPFLERINESQAYRTQLDEAVMRQFLSTLHDYAQNCLNEAQRLGYEAETKSDDERIEAGRFALQNTPRLIYGYLNPKLSKGLKFPQINITDEAIESYLKEQVEEISKISAPGIPVFFSVNIDAQTQTWEVSSIKLSPVGRIIGKESVSAFHLAQDQKIEPATSLGTTSPGDTMWGFVPQTKNDRETPTSGLRGRILLEPAHFSYSTSSSPVADTQLLKVHHPAHLITLASPKPRTGVPYLRNSEGANLERKTPQAEHKNPFPREHTFLTGQTLIRKVYPTHQQLINTQEAIPESSADTAMASKIASWIEPDAVFHSRIHFINLSNQELAILLWLLQPTMLAEHVTGIEEGYHHLGFGKPLGMGTVRIKATSYHILKGHQVATQYKTLSGISGSFNPVHLDNGRTEKVKPLKIQGHVNKYLPEGFRMSLPVKCFRKQACGWKDRTPVSYPFSEKKRSQPGGVSDNPTLLWFRKREDNRANLAALYDESDPAKEEAVRKAEEDFGKYSFPGLDE